MASTYIVEAHYPAWAGTKRGGEDGWIDLFLGTRSECFGYFEARRFMRPCPALRVRNEVTDKIVWQQDVKTDADLGMIAGFPTARQYVNASLKALRAATGVKYHADDPDEVFCRELAQALLDTADQILAAKGE